MAANQVPGAGGGQRPAAQNGEAQGQQAAQETRQNNEMKFRIAKLLRDANAEKSIADKLLQSA